MRFYYWIKDEDGIVIKDGVTDLKPGDKLSLNYAFDMAMQASAFSMFEVEQQRTLRFGARLANHRGLRVRNEIISPEGVTLLQVVVPTTFVEYELIGFISKGFGVKKWKEAEAVYAPELSPLNIARAQVGDVLVSHDYDNGLTLRIVVEALV